jgi:mRNA interferase MazF
MPSYSRGEIVLIRYPFADLSGAKVRPAVVVNGPHSSLDIIIVPLTSRTTHLLTGEFVLADHQGAGLTIPTAVKRGLHTVQENQVITKVGNLRVFDLDQVDRSIKFWLGYAQQP